MRILLKNRCNFCSLAVDKTHWELLRLAQAVAMVPEERPLSPMTIMLTKSKRTA
jgi:hypothetical protein